MENDLNARLLLARDREAVSARWRRARKTNREDSLGDKVLLGSRGGRVKVECSSNDLLDDAGVQVDARAELGVSSGHLGECRRVSWRILALNGRVNIEIG